MLLRPLFCFLLALHVPLSFFANNQSLFEPSGILRTLLVFQIIAAALYWVSKRLTGSVLYSMLIAASPFIYYGALVTGLAQPVVIATCAVLLTLAASRFINHQNLVRLLNIAILAALLQPLYTIAAFRFSPPPEVTAQDELFEYGGTSFNLNSLALAPGVELPSILHMTLDAYASDRVLSEIMNFDNSLFSHSLEKLGFVVFDQAISPYNWTLLTMSAMFSGEYFDLGNVTGRDTDRLALAKLSKRGQVRDILSAMSYEMAYNNSGYYSLPSLFPPGSRIDATDHEDVGLGMFEYEFLYKPLSNLALPPDSGQQPAEDEPVHYVVHPTLFTFLTFRSDFITTLHKPFLYNFHVMAPHPPFILNREGGGTGRWVRDFGGLSAGSHAHQMNPALQRKYVDGYLEKLRFTNRATLGYVRKFLASQPGPVVIIIHGDHGSGVLLDLESSENSCARERFSPYLAIYSNSETIQRRLARHAQEPFNLVNVYRVLFDELFVQDVALQDNRSYFVPWDNMPGYSQVDSAAIEQRCELPWDKELPRTHN